MHLFFCRLEMFNSFQGVIFKFFLIIKKILSKGNNFKIEYCIINTNFSVFITKLENNITYKVNI
jgi:hypothetical protein